MCWLQLCLLFHSLSFFDYLLSLASLVHTKIPVRTMLVFLCKVGYFAPHQTTGRSLNGICVKSNTVGSQALHASSSCKGPTRYTMIYGLFPST